MPSGIRIDDLRLSFIWAETALDFMSGSVSPTAPLALLGRSHQYASAFEQALGTGAGPHGLQVPWKPHTRRPQFFWSYYLERHIPGHVSGGRAWRKLVPFRMKAPVTVMASWLPGRLDLQFFLFPHGIALVATVQCRSDLTLQKAVDKALEVRRTGRFLVRWGEAPTREYLSLDGLANEGLNALHRFALGPNANPRAAPINQPFTVATVVSGTGVDRSAPPPKEVLHALLAMAKWPSYDWQDPPPSEEPHVDEADQSRTKERYAGDVLYYHTRGRAVWFPKHFLPAKDRQVAASCYHRNLVALSLQVESLGDLVSRTARQIQTRTPPSPGSSHHWCAKQAAINLSLLYGGGGDEKRTYRAWSARRQIEQNNLVTAVNAVRDHICGLGPLSP
jgi:hypothetical protein